MPAGTKGLALHEPVFIRHRKGDEVFVETDGLMQPLPGLMQIIDAVTNTKTIPDAIFHLLSLR